MSGAEGARGYAAMGGLRDPRGAHISDSFSWALGTPRLYMFSVFFGDLIRSKAMVRKSTKKSHLAVFRFGGRSRPEALLAFAFIPVPKLLVELRLVIGRCPASLPVSPSAGACAPLCAPGRRRSSQLEEQLQYRPSSSSYPPPASSSSQPPPSLLS